MSTIQDIFRVYGPEYLALYGDRMPENHKKVMNAICDCRSGSFGTVVRSNQKVAYTALFSCAHESLKKLAKDKRFIGSSRIGYLAVLHTWGGNLQYHPHLHLVIPGGALSEKDEQWLPSR